MTQQLLISPFRRFSREVRTRVDRHSAVHLPFPLPESQMRSPSPRRACIIRQCDQYEPTVQSEAEALANAGFDVEVICISSAGSRRRVVVNAVTIVRMPV